MTVVTSDGQKILDIGSLAPDPVAAIEPTIEPTAFYVPNITVGDMVFYTGKTSGKKREYMVGWAGECNKTGKPKLGLHCYGLCGKLFFVEESAVEQAPMKFHSPV